MTLLIRQFFTDLVIETEVNCHLRGLFVKGQAATILTDDPNRNKRFEDETFSIPPGGRIEVTYLQEDRCISS